MYESRFRNAHPARYYARTIVILNITQYVRPHVDLQYIIFGITENAECLYWSRKAICNLHQELDYRNIINNYCNNIYSTMMMVMIMETLCSYYGQYTILLTYYIATIIYDKQQL